LKKIRFLDYLLSIYWKRRN